ncbi:DUF3290 domain-containing protein [Carnobacterium divergens]|uniref:DUF3290 domain-containing protein n=2 Tax=Carnobacterium divergens TaxID=2748 RepID=A0A0R2HYN8_CARDV|nr:DUF3290 domain-containing protein [Carnobacterium divergens]AOA00649.1 hypothetical protein BFC22_11360 [Carnobacterium divergens]KRN57913.1 hypothetical protein IV74_GL001169 [Carnobacterium divergens DSM 20623]MDO0874543.1 DUF3290 domain-containing protein [Carnobacterium divergens]MDT1956903.1 DUF3290 domain-containing protein [Carnobacterium divergens]MDT1972873.1 DUF3290 domain-containing protein [Carnobacterium divergens]
MQFYTFDYLVSQSNVNSYVKYTIIFFVLLFLTFVIIKYMRDRVQTKYRDLSIIFFLILVFIIGIQFTDYSQSQSTVSQSAQMVQFIEQLGKEKKVKADEILVNSTVLNDEMVVKIDQKFYQVDFNSDFSAYHTQNVQLVNPAITIVKEN